MARMAIDEDLWIATTEYVLAQVATMRKYGDLARDWDEKMQNDTIQKVAEYPQKIRNMTSKRK